MKPFKSIWNTDHMKWTKYLYKTTNVSLMTNALLVSICIPMALFKYDLDLLEFSETLSWWTVLTPVSVTCATFYHRMEDILSLVTDLYAMQTPDQLIDEKQKTIRHTSQWISQLIILLSITFVGIVLTVIPFFFWPELYKKRIFIYRLWLPIDHKCTTNYDILFPYLTYNTTLLVIMAGFTYLFVISILIHVVAQFKILNIKFRNIRPQAVHNLQKKVSEEYYHHVVQVGEKIRTKMHQKEMKKRVMYSTERHENNPHLREKRLEKEMERIIRDCIIHHQALTRWMRKFESLFRVTISIDMVALLLCGGIALMLAVKLDTLEKKAILVSGLCGFGAVNSFLRTMLIELLSSESEYIRDAAYGSDWIEASSRYKKSISIIISRSNVPIGINGLGGMPITFVTYHKLIKTAFSFYQFTVESELRR